VKNPQDPAKPPLGDARQSTDASLRAERLRADRALRARLKAGEREVAEEIERTHEAVAGEVAQATDEALAQAPAPTAVEQVAAQAQRSLEEAQRSLEEQRERLEELSAAEREETKRAFLDVLAAERRKTDKALALERDSSDHQVHTRDDVLGVISHDLRNYLSVVAMKASLLSAVAPEGDTAKLQGLATDIADACRTMARWANDLVDVSTIETGGISLHRDVHDVADIIGKSTSAFLPKAAAKGITLTTAVPDERPRVACDRDRLLQVLNNLLDNALKFGETELSIAVEPGPAGFVTISVSDRGPGIAEADREKVFERAWHASKGKAGGSGLGLYISKRIVEAHGGSIWVESHVGRGATFRFTVPVARASSSTTGASAPGRAGRAPP
jgi:signal transduction histidine kinase